MSIDYKDIARDWQERGYTCNMWTDLPGQIWRDYVHEVDEIIVVLQGEVEIDVAGRSMRPVLGDEVNIPAGVAHTVKNVGGDMAVWLYGRRKEDQA